MSGVSPKDGVLNSFCQTHDVSISMSLRQCIPIYGDKHPTLTMMALAARAVIILSRRQRVERDIGSLGCATAPLLWLVTKYKSKSGDRSPHSTIALPLARFREAYSRSCSSAFPRRSRYQACLRSRQALQSGVRNDGDRQLGVPCHDALMI